MFTKTVFAAVAATVVLIAAAPAQAQEVGSYMPTTETSMLTREEVRMEAIQARAMRGVGHTEEGPMVDGFHAMKTRAQVRAETLEAIRVGAINRTEQSVLPTAEQLRSIEMAGQRALAMNVAAL